MNELKKYTDKLFEDIKHMDEEGNEYWDARELQKVLEYVKWERFLKVINESKVTCEKNGYVVDDHFPSIGKMVRIGSNTYREVQNYKLSRYACYLIVLNCDPRKDVIALAKNYFAIQTRKQEILEKVDYDSLTEDQKRLFQRAIIKKDNKMLNIAAKDAGVKNFDKFTNAGYRGLYNGEDANDIAKRKKLRYNEDILDNMSSEELADNIFRIAHTEAKLKRDNVKSEKDANKTHYEVGKEVRNTLKRLGSMMPEELPKPDKSTKVLEKEIKYMEGKLINYE